MCGERLFLSWSFMLQMSLCIQKFFKILSVTRLVLTTVGLQDVCFTTELRNLLYIVLKLIVLNTMFASDCTETSVAKLTNYKEQLFAAIYPIWMEIFYCFWWIVTIENSLKIRHCDWSIINLLLSLWRITVTMCENSYSIGSLWFV